MEYCRWCGKRMSLKHTGLYDEDTGEKIMDMKCTNFWCPHSDTPALVFAVVFVALIVGVIISAIVW